MVVQWRPVGWCALHARFSPRARCKPPWRSAAFDAMIVLRPGSRALIRSTGTGGGAGSGICRRLLLLGNVAEPSHPLWQRRRCVAVCRSNHENRGNTLLDVRKAGHGLRSRSRCARCEGDGNDSQRSQKHSGFLLAKVSVSSSHKITLCVPCQQEPVREVTFRSCCLDAHATATRSETRPVEVQSRSMGTSASAAREARSGSSRTSIRPAPG